MRHFTEKPRVGPLFAAFIATLLCLALHACNGAADQQMPGNAAASRARDYSVLTLTPRPATVFYDFPATMQGQQVIEIRPKVDGYIEAIHVQEGATVKKGQLLFKISNPQYEQEVRTAEASVTSAVAAVNAAQMNVNKVQPLVDKGIISEYQLQSARYTLESEQAALAQARAALANARSNLGYTFIRAPQNGVIGTIPHKIGALVSSATTEPLTTLSNIGNVYAYFSVNEKQLLAFTASAPGSTIEEMLNEMPPVSLLLANGQEYSQKGKLETASGLISTETGTVPFKATFPNPLGIIRSGASATVRIPRTFDSTLLIPQSATYELQNKRFVYTVGNDNKVFSVPVGTNPTNDGQFFMVEEGLAPGQRIVIEGVASLKDSMPIIPKPVSADSLYHKMQQ